MDDALGGAVMQQHQQWGGFPPMLPHQPNGITKAYKTLDYAMVMQQQQQQQQQRCRSLLVSALAGA